LYAFTAVSYSLFRRNKYIVSSIYPSSRAHATGTCADVQLLRYAVLLSSLRCNSNNTPSSIARLFCHGGTLQPTLPANPSVTRNPPHEQVTTPQPCKRNYARRSRKHRTSASPSSAGTPLLLLALLLLATAHYLLPFSTTQFSFLLDSGTAQAALALRLPHALNTLPPGALVC
jgi:hypothetical protein